MSLEDAINNHATAIRELAAVMAGKVNNTTVADAKKPASVKSATTSPQSDVKAPAAESPTIDFNKIRESFVAMVKTKGNAAAVELLTHFGLDATKGGKLSQIPVERHAELMVEIAKRSA